MHTATFRFYAELNDFIARERRFRAFDHACPEDATVKHAIEALGVPDTEVELVLVNGVSVGFGHVLRNGDRVSVFPIFEAFDVSELLRVRAQPLRRTAFLCDAHLGGLARLLRMAGFDTRFDPALRDDEIVRVAVEEGRIVLTRDRDLLKRRDVTHGCHVRATRNEDQLREVAQRLDLGRSARPFTICLECNAPVRALGADEAASRVPPGVRGRFERYTACDRCGRVYWEGSHWRRMHGMLADALAASETRA
jgi:uncharacterized protein with PIN domain/sulfur carrier protein ThiS